MKHSQTILPIFILLAAFLSLACCMLQKSYEGSIQQQSQEALIIYDNGVQDLVLKVSPEITGKKKWESFCWLITVPNEPDFYEVREPNIFNELFNLKQKYLVRPIPKNYFDFVKSSMESTESSAILDIELGRHVTIGAYDIQPIRGVGENAFGGLNNWLEKNGFPIEPESHMKYFVDNHFTFLCIKVQSSEEKNTENIPELKPLHLTFKSEKIYYPMKYSSQQGNFSVNLYTLTTKPIDYEQSAKTLERIDWNNQNLFKNVNIANIEKTSNIKSTIESKKGPYLYFNNFYCQQPNKNGAIKSWQEDVFLSLNESHTPNSANMMEKEGLGFPLIIFIIASFITFIFFLNKKRKNIEK